MAPADFTSKLNDIKSEISFLKTSMITLRSEMDRIKIEDEKILDLLTKMHDNFDKIFNNVMKLVSDNAVQERERVYIHENILGLGNKLSELEKKHSALEKWIWLVSGGGMVLGSIATILLRQAGMLLN